MFARITWLESAESYAVKLKKYEDSFECALCNSDGRVHSPTRYLCRIRPDKLEWHTVKLEQPIVVHYPKGEKIKKIYPQIRDRVSKLNISEWATKYGEQNTKKEIYGYLGVKQNRFDYLLQTGELGVYHRKGMENFMKDKEVIKLDPEDTKERVKYFLHETEEGIHWFQKNANINNQNIKRLIEEGFIYPSGEKRIIQALEKFEQEKGY